MCLPEGSQCKKPVRTEKSQIQSLSDDRFAGIGRGQRICLYVIPEVVELISDLTASRFKAV